MIGRNANHAANRDLGRSYVHITAESILGCGFMLREDERQGCCVWVSFSAPFSSWLAPLNNSFSVVCWNPHGSWRI